MIKKSLISWIDFFTKIIALLLALFAVYSSWGGKERTNMAYALIIDALNKDMGRIDAKFDHYAENQAKIRESLAALTEAVSFLRETHHQNRNRPIFDAVEKAEKAIEEIKPTQKPAIISSQIDSIGRGGSSEEYKSSPINNSVSVRLPAQLEMAIQQKATD